MTKLARGLLAVVLGVIAAGLFAVAGTWRGGLAGGALIGIGVYVAPAISDYLSRRRSVPRQSGSALSAFLLAR